MTPLFLTLQNEIKWTNFYVRPDKYLPFKLEFVLTLSPWRLPRPVDDDDPKTIPGKDEPANESEIPNMDGGKTFIRINVFCCVRVAM